MFQQKKIYKLLINSLVTFGILFTSTPAQAQNFTTPQNQVTPTIITQNIETDTNIAISDNIETPNTTSFYTNTNSNTTEINTKSATECSIHSETEKNIFIKSGQQIRETLFESPFTADSIPEISEDLKIIINEDNQIILVGDPREENKILKFYIEGKFCDNTPSIRYNFQLAIVQDMITGSENKPLYKTLLSNNYNLKNQSGLPSGTRAEQQSGNPIFIQGIPHKSGKYIFDITATFSDSILEIKYLFVIEIQAINRDEAHNLKTYIENENLNLQLPISRPSTEHILQDARITGLEDISHKISYENEQFVNLQTQFPRTGNWRFTLHTSYESTEIFQIKPIHITDNFIIRITNPGELDSLEILVDNQLEKTDTDPNFIGRHYTGEMSLTQLDNINKTIVREKAGKLKFENPKITESYLNLEPQTDHTEINITGFTEKTTRNTHNTLIVIEAENIDILLNLTILVDKNFFAENNHVLRNISKDTNPVFKQDINLNITVNEENFNEFQVKQSGLPASSNCDLISNEKYSGWAISCTNPNRQEYQDIVFDLYATRKSSQTNINYVEYLRFTFNIESNVNLELQQKTAISNATFYDKINISSESDNNPNIHPNTHKFTAQCVSDTLVTNTQNLKEKQNCDPEIYGLQNPESKKYEYFLALNTISPGNHTIKISLERTTEKNSITIGNTEHTIEAVSLLKSEPNMTGWTLNEERTEENGQPITINPQLTEAGYVFPESGFFYFKEQQAILYGNLKLSPKTSGNTLTGWNVYGKIDETFPEDRKIYFQTEYHNKTIHTQLPKTTVAISIEFNE